MAVNINTVYLRVLAIANKEQRGYITPQEFNTLANQAQLDIFEQYFYDLNQFLRLPGNDTIHSDAVDMLEEKIGIFEVYDAPITSSDTLSEQNVHKLGAVYNSTIINGVQTKVEAEKLNPNELRYYLNSPLTAPTVKRPVFIVQTDLITVLPAEADSLSMNYIKKPADVYWGYVMINDEALYNPATSINFELHASEETELVLKILTLAGVTIRDPQLYQIAAAEDAKNIQQEKQ